MGNIMNERFMFLYSWMQNHLNHVFPLQVVISVCCLIYCAFSRVVSHLLHKLVFFLGCGTYVAGSLILELARQSAWVVFCLFCSLPLVVLFEEIAPHGGSLPILSLKEVG